MFFPPQSSGHKIKKCMSSTSENKKMSIINCPYENCSETVGSVHISHFDPKEDIISNVCIY